MWKQYKEEGVRGSHDGMDWLVFREFFDSILNETSCPIDVHTLCCTLMHFPTVLSI